MHQPLTQNLYLYVSGNPLNYVDPSGHSWLGNAWNSVVGAVKSAVKAVSSAVSKVVSTVKNVVNNVIAPAVANVANAVKNTISKAVSHVVNGVQKVIGSIDDAINGAPSSGSKRGESILHPTLDMGVKTLIERNREFCSADAMWASSNKRKPNKKFMNVPAIAVEASNKYREGTIAPAALSHVMNLVYNWYLADSPKSKDTYMTWLTDFVMADYKTTSGDFTYVDANIAFLSERPTSFPISKEVHYFRNKLNLNFSWEQFQKLQQRLPSNLKWLEGVRADYHQVNTPNKDNRKYVSADGCFELIFSAQNILLTQYNDPDNMGTFNYYHPDKERYEHFLYDVEPYGAVPGFLKWGNIPK